MGEPDDQQGEQQGAPQPRPDESPKPTEEPGGALTAHTLHLADKRLPAETRVRRCQEQLDVQTEDDSRQEQEQREVGEAQSARQVLWRGKSGELLLWSGAG